MQCLQRFRSTAQHLDLQLFSHRNGRCEILAGPSTRTRVSNAAMPYSAAMPAMAWACAMTCSTASSRGPSRSDTRRLARSIKQSSIRLLSVSADRIARRSWRRAADNIDAGAGRTATASSWTCVWSDRCTSYTCCAITSSNSCKEPGQCDQHGRTGDDAASAEWRLPCPRFSTPPPAQPPDFRSGLAGIGSRRPCRGKLQERCVCTTVRGCKIPSPAT
jgi:hypothetical protein